MQVVILAGGLGTRLSEETDLIPKPMVSIGDVPILIHIMRYYSTFGHKNFIIAMGYKSMIIQQYFEEHNVFIGSLGWNVNLIDTGLNTATGGRILRLEDFLEEEFLMTYGDGLSNVDLAGLIAHHKNSGKMATVTAVRPPARFGSLEIGNGMVTRFSEKNPQEAGWINGGFFCLQKSICNLIIDDNMPFENEPMAKLVSLQELAAFDHHGWWQPMDSLRDKRILEEIWNEGRAPWVNSSGPQ